MSWLVSSGKEARRRRRQDLRNEHTTDKLQMLCQDNHSKTAETLMTISGSFHAAVQCMAQDVIDAIVKPVGIILL